MCSALKTVPSREGDIYFLLLRFSATLENVAEISILKSVSTWKWVPCIHMDTNLHHPFFLLQFENIPLNIITIMTMYRVVVLLPRCSMDCSEIMDMKFEENFRLIIAIFKNMFFFVPKTLNKITVYITHCLIVKRTRTFFMKTSERSQCLNTTSNKQHQAPLH